MTTPFTNCGQHVGSTPFATVPIHCVRCNKLLDMTPCKSCGKRFSETGADLCEQCESAIEQEEIEEDEEAALDAQEDE